MEQYETVHPEYQAGFNQGYLLQEHMPDLAGKLSHVTGESLRLSGLKHGIEQFNFEKSKDHYPAWLKKDRLSSLDKDQDREKDKGKDDLDLERE